MYLFFDTETTGLPKNWRAKITDVDNWPRMVQLAWIMCDNTGNSLEECNYIIKPDGYKIPNDVARLHGITTERALQEGHPLLSVLELFSDKIDEAHVLVAHNISFDECIVGAEFERNRMMTSFFLKTKICTMKISTNFCKLPGAKKGYKSPKLVELHQILFDEIFDNAHDALADVRATVRCFWKLKELNVIN